MRRTGMDTDTADLLKRILFLIQKQPQKHAILNRKKRKKDEGETEGGEGGAGRKEEAKQPDRHCIPSSLESRLVLTSC